MEHLRRPTKPANPPIRVPYLCLSDYDRLGFSDYPTRQGFHKGWLVSEFRHLDSQQRVYDKAKIKHLIQSWLFFGMLVEVLDVSGLEVNTRDFVREEEGGERWLTTGKLVGYLDGWVKQAGLFDKDMEARHIRKVDDCLREAAKYIRNLAWDGKWSQGFLVQEIAVSILGLFGALCNARDRRVAHEPENLVNNPLLGVPIVGVSQITYDRLRKGGWCPSQIAKVLENIPFEDVLFYLGEMVRPKARTDHSKCSEVECLANRIDRATYRTRHVEEGCACEYVEVDVNKLAQILQSGDFPLVRISETPGGKVTLEVVARKSCEDYVAISHVWGQGLGNVKQNALPRCQLLRLPKLISGVQEFHWDPRKHGDDPRKFLKQSLPIWIDTLCIPIDPQLKRVAVSRMRETFQEARDVLVLDAEIQQSSYGDFFEANFRICCSDWSRRLWTYQEGALAKNLIFQFANEPVHYTRDFYMQIAANFTGPIPLGSTSFPGDLDQHFDSHNSAAATLRNDTFGSFDSVDKSALFKKEDKLKHLTEMVSALQYRSTTDAEDEPICIASLLQLDVGAVLAESRQRRMIKVFQLLKSVPATLLFMTGPKIGPFHPYPSSFLGRVDPLLTHRALDRTGRFYVTDFDDYPEMEAQVTERGLLVKRPGFFVKCLRYQFSKGQALRLMTMEKAKLPGVDDVGPKPTPDAKRMYKVTMTDPSARETLDRGLESFIIVLQNVHGMQGPDWNSNGVILARPSYKDGMPFSFFHPRAFGGDGRSLGPKEALCGRYAGFVTVKAGWSTDQDHADLEVFGVKFPQGKPEGSAVMGFKAEQEFYLA